MVVFSVHLHGVQRTWDMICATLRELHSCPFLPVGAAARDRHGFVTWLDDLGSYPRMDAQPGIKGQAFLIGPLDVIVDRNERILALLSRAHRGNQLFEAFGLS